MQAIRKLSSTSFKKDFKRNKKNLPKYGIFRYPCLSKFFIQLKQWSESISVSYSFYCCADSTNTTRFRMG